MNVSIRILTGLPIVCASGVAAAVVLSASESAAKDRLHDPTLIPNCSAIGGELIVMTSDLTACCLEDGCWICDDAGDCEWDPAYSSTSPPGGKRPILGTTGTLKVQPAAPANKPAATSNKRLNEKN